MSDTLRKLTVSGIAVPSDCRAHDHVLGPSRCSDAVGKHTCRTCAICYLPSAGRGRFRPPKTIFSSLLAEAVKAKLPDATEVICTESFVLLASSLRSTFA